MPFKNMYFKHLIGIRSHKVDFIFQMSPNSNLRLKCKIACMSSLI